MCDIDPTKNPSNFGHGDPKLRLAGQEGAKIENAIKKTGCSDLNDLVNECHFEHKDWRKCTFEMKMFRDCMEKYKRRRDSAMSEQRRRGGGG